jgi:hypothetical protein
MVRLKGLPWDTKAAAVFEFLSDVTVGDPAQTLFMYNDATYVP